MEHAERTELLREASFVLLEIRRVRVLKEIGRTGGETIRISVGGEAAVTLAVADAEREWSNAVEQYFAKRVA